MKIDFSQAPFIVGTVTTWEALQAFPSRKDIHCDILEARLDHIGWIEDWLPACKAIESMGIPVLLTLRMKIEGGKWDELDEGRQEILELALTELAAIDVELQSNLVPRLCRKAAELGKTVVISHHDFNETPSEERLREIAIDMASYDNSVIKMATHVNQEEDIERLEALLAQDFRRPICLIGMGDLGQRTRVEFPDKGSALTYAYLDSPSAPGQLSCAEAAKQLGRS